MQRRELAKGWDKDLPTFPPDAKGLATRESSALVLNAIAKNVPDLMGGAADLAPSTKTNMKGAGDFEADNYAGRNLHFGIREHAMGGILNGLAVSKLRAYGSTFLIFSDYFRNPIRLAALMELPVVYVFTHDSIGLGEDGPTHQPVEQLASLRAIPGLITLRPADAAEVVEAWKYIMPLRHEPVALILTRQAVPTLDRTRYASAAGLQRGAYVLADAPNGKPEVLLLGTGSEVSLCIDAYEKLKADGIAARGEHAIVGDFRELLPSASGISGERHAGRRDRARFGRASGNVWLGSIRGREGSEDRHAHVRCVSAAQSVAKEIWLHARRSGRPGQEVGEADVGPACRAGPGWHLASGWFFCKGGGSGYLPPARAGSEWIVARDY